MTKEFDLEPPISQSRAYPMQPGLRLALIRDIVAREVYGSRPKDPWRAAGAGGCFPRPFNTTERLQRPPASQEGAIVQREEFPGGQVASKKGPATSEGRDQPFFGWTAWIDSSPSRSYNPAYC